MCILKSVPVSIAMSLFDKVKSVPAVATAVTTPVPTSILLDLPIILTLPSPSTATIGVFAVPNVPC